jgi:hypothetical protein
MANYKSQRDGQLVEFLAAGLPAKTVEYSTRFDTLRRGATIAGHMNTLVIVIMLEGAQFSL